MFTPIVLFVPFCCGYEQIIQFCSGFDVRAYRDGKDQECDSVSWGENRSVIQLCARQEGGKEEGKNTEKLRAGWKGDYERKKGRMP